MLCVCNYFKRIVSNGCNYPDMSALAKFSVGSPFFLLPIFFVYGSFGTLVQAFVLTCVCKYQKIEFQVGLKLNDDLGVEKPRNNQDGYYACVGGGFYTLAAVGF